MAIEQVRELENVMQEAFDKKASMVYVMPNEPPVFRVDHAIERSGGNSFTAQQIQDIATAAFGKEALKEIGTETGQLRTLYTLEGIVDGYMSAVRVNGDYMITVRMLPTSLPDVGASRVPEAILEAAMSQTGLVLFSGPTGCGKTTSLYSTMDSINAQKPCTICSVEYSIDYHLEGKKGLVLQHEVGVDVPDMMEGISAAISKAADVLMIGELRNVDQIHMSIVASSNMLVLTQLHADTPQAAIQRMIDIFPPESVKVPRKILADKLRGACAQKLLDRADGKGKVAAYGVLIPDETMRKAIIEGRGVFDRDTPLPEGCRTLARDIEDLFEDGIIGKNVRDQALGELDYS